MEQSCDLSSQGKRVQRLHVEREEHGDWSGRPAITRDPSVQLRGPQRVTARLVCKRRSINVLHEPQTAPGSTHLFLAVNVGNQAKITDIVRCFDILKIRFKNGHIFSLPPPSDIPITV